MAQTASITGTARTATHGSWRPLSARRASLISFKSTLSCSMKIEDVGLNAARTTTGSPVEMPPRMPPALFDAKTTRPSRTR